MASIAFFGATGMTGSRILREALDRGRDVVAVVRDRTKLTRTHPALRVVTGDVLQPTPVSSGARSQDVVVSAVGGGHGNGPGHLARAEPAVRSLVAGLRALDGGPAGTGLISVGGAGSLRIPAGKRLWDTAGLPEYALQIMHASGDALE